MIRLKPELNFALTAARSFGAQLAKNISDPVMIQKFRARSFADEFYVVGPGGSLNDLTPAQKARLASGTSISINMAALAPIDFDLCAQETIRGKGDLEALQGALRAKSEPLVWFQNRKKHDNIWVEALDREFKFYRYKRIPVSVKGDLTSFKTTWDRLISPHIFSKPNLNTCFAFTGSIARATILGIMLGYRRFGFAGIDLGSTEYFWLENTTMKGFVPSENLSDIYQVMSTGAITQGGQKNVPSFFDFLRILKQSRPEVELFTLDPKSRSRVTEFLASL